MENLPAPVNNSQSKPDHDESSNTWILEVVTGPHASKKFTMDELLNEPKLNKKTLTISMIHPGFDAGGKQRASQETSTWLGFPLSEVLHLCGINNTHTPKKYLNLLFTGVGHDKAIYQFSQTSLKVEVATDPAREITLASDKNGNPLSLGDAGNPLRLILPGFASGGMLKGLNKIQVQQLQPLECLELKINSVITDPCHDKKLYESSLTDADNQFRGYAYSGGGCQVTRVEISLDGGETWKKCKLDPLEKPSKYGKFWHSRGWSIEVGVARDLLPVESNVKEIVVRAFDKSGQAQPDDQNPNIEGMNNCWYKVKIKPLEGKNAITFEHPPNPRDKLVANDQPAEPSHSANDQASSET